MQKPFDFVLVGGGLQSALIALAVLAERPRSRVAIVEAGTRLGGNHTWCFHGEVPSFAESLVVQRWPSWSVLFPGLERTFQSSYSSISSARLHQVVAASGAVLFSGRRALTLTASDVTLDGGETLRGERVIDARGPTAVAKCAWQKFLGVEVELSRPSGIERPLVMDATVEQLDGFRFLYVLPYGERRLLLEDTYFSTNASLDEAVLEARIATYARTLPIARVLRRERGALPLPLEWRPQASRAEEPFVAGYRGGFFHPTTGYSFPIAARLAALIAKGGPLAPFVEAHDRQARFAVMLNRLLFGATAEPHRRDVLERFHHLPDQVVERFYALETTASDRLRIVCGRPPRGVSLLQALNQVVFA